MKKIIVTLAVLTLFFSVCQTKAANKNNFEEINNTQNIQNSADESLGYSNRASVKFLKQDFNGAIEDFNKAISINSRNPMLFLNRGYIKQYMFDYSGAMEDYNSALKINPNFAYAYNNRGVLKVSMKDIKGAFEDYEKALNINPKYADAYYNRANLKYMTNDNKGALADYDLAIKYNPKDAEAYNNRGVVKKRMNFNVGALSDYTQAITLNPSDSIALANRGRLKKLYFDNEGAAIDLDKAVALAENQVFIKNVKPLLSNEHYITAVPEIKSYSAQPENVKNDIEKHIAYSPAPSANSIKQAPKEIEQQKREEAKKIALEKKNAQADKEVKKSSGTVLSAGVGTVKIATAPDIRTEKVTKAATTNVKLAESYYIRGLQKCVLRDMQGAVADLDKAIANNNKYADAYYYRAAIKKELGDIEGFKSDYRTAIKIKPDLQAYNESDLLSMVR